MMMTMVLTMFVKIISTISDEEATNQDDASSFECAQLKR